MLIHGSDPALQDAARSLASALPVLAWQVAADLECAALGDAKQATKNPGKKTVDRRGECQVQLVQPTSRCWEACSSASSACSRSSRLRWACSAASMRDAAAFDAACAGSVISSISRPRDCSPDVRRRLFKSSSSSLLNQTLI